MLGKVIVITGANGGLGRALAQRFAAEGEKVVLLGRSYDKVAEVAAAIGDAALPIACEVTSPDSVRAAFAEIARVHPKIDVLINNAGVFQPFEIEHARDEQIIDGILTNLAGPVLCCRSAIPMMERGGLIINVSSESVVVPLAHLLIYQSSKAGLERFSLGLAEELEEQGIRTCIVRAGQMMGPGMSATMDPEAGAKFHMATLKRGIDVMKRGITMYDSATQVFRNVIDLPQDLHVDIVSMHARPPAAT
jgi:meso-butanediol dehydrogenase/(S,S)-butanediol dehydrogenase/diacetyl reductase